MIEPPTTKDQVVTPHELENINVEPCVTPIQPDEIDLFERPAEDFDDDMACSCEHTVSEAPVNADDFDAIDKKDFDAIDELSEKRNRVSTASTASSSRFSWTQN